MATNDMAETEGAPIHRMAVPAKPLESGRVPIAIGGPRTAPDLSVPKLFDAPGIVRHAAPGVPDPVVPYAPQFPDLPLEFEEDRQEHRRHGVEVGRVAPRARVEAGLEHQLVEHLAVLLPEGAAVVHPLVDDRLRMEAVRRHGATHGTPRHRGLHEI